MELNSCSVGQSMKEICHTAKFTRKSGMKSISELESDELDLIQIRCCLSLSTKDTVCLHHEQMYIHKYSNWQVTCRDPIQLHNKRVAYKYLKTLNFLKLKLLTTYTN